MRMRLWLGILFGIWVLCAQAQPLTISIVPDWGIRENPVSANALEDFTALLNMACHCIDAQNPEPDVLIRLVDPLLLNDGPVSPFMGRNYPYFQYPAHNFVWTQSQYILPATDQDAGVFIPPPRTQTLTLTAPSFEGIANGLYALLQERLGFRFVHARQTIIPQLDKWPIPPARTAIWGGRPKFDKKGFHLHTMHPLELTEALHNPDFPGGLAMIEEYILWLARNGQNYFEFSLMEDVDHDLDRWVAHATQFTQYAHARGILCGLDLSIHMVQQKAYQLVKFPPGDFKPYETQVRSRIRRLMHANWDFLNLEFALAEFVGGLEGLRNRLRDAVIAEMDHYPQTKLIGRQHVVKPEDEVGGSHGEQSLNIPSDPRMGVLVHTVMCYALTDKRAPVYELENFSHLLQMLKEQNQQRETWFYPESAYWITFDSSVPLLLLPYLNARYKDIQTCEALGIPGHVTFSSGWEWGYWLIDWSIARWSWAYEGQTDAEMPAVGPYQYLVEFFPPEARDEVTALADLQQSWLIENDLVRWMCPASPADDLPGPINKQFQPRGFANLGDLGKAAYRSPERLLELPIDSLYRYASTCQKKAEALHWASAMEPQPTRLAIRLGWELTDALLITALRARHSAQLMEAVQAYAHSHASQAALRQELRPAIQTRQEALEIVRRQEARYRYPLAQLASRYHSHTAYDFGYLYTVHNLHFWEREEQQLLKGRTGPFFWNIYELAKIAGVKN